jgi:Tfp pilus assembly protein PilN
MIKINLLPASINERRIVKNTAILFGVLVVAVVAVGMLYTYLFLIPKVQAEEELAVRTEALEQEVLGIEKQRDEWKAKIPPIRQKLDFINNVLDYNQRFPKLYEDVARWTYEKIAYTDMTSDGIQVSMSARARSLDDVGRFLLNMYQATDLFTEVVISGVPGYPMDSGGASQVQNFGPGGWAGGGPQANLAGIEAISTGVQQGPQTRYIGFTVNCRLRTPIVAPVFGAGAATAGVPGTPGMPPPGGGPGMMPSTGPMPPGGPMPPPPGPPQSSMAPGGGAMGTP